jgi:hypothetical protein
MDEALEIKFGDYIYFCEELASNKYQSYEIKK